VADGTMIRARIQSSGLVAFDNVSFAYPESGKPVLRNLSFQAGPDQMVAIVGPSGSGKSTIAKLLLRFYDADAGRVLLDGADIRNLSLRTLRHNVTLLQQENLLFSETIADNIGYGKRGATPARSGRRRGRPAPTSSSPRCRMATRPRSASEAACCPAGSGSVSSSSARPFGLRAHLPAVNAAIGRAQLACFAETAGRRQRLWRAYREALGGLDGVTLVDVDVDRTVPFNCVVRIAARRAEVFTRLRAQGAGVGVHYPPNHVQPAFAAWHRPLPRTELAGRQVLSLPFHPALDIKDAGRVAGLLGEALR
jgi:hypothetical protein